MHTGFLPLQRKSSEKNILGCETSQLVSPPSSARSHPSKSTPQPRTPAEPDSIYEKGPELEAFQICYPRQPSKPRFPTGFLSLMANSCFILHYFPALCHTPAAR